jgi:Skp family chaperone for outer membrane proteins
LPDTDAYTEKNKALIQFQIDTEVWAKMMDMDQQRKQKTSNKMLFDKIQDAVAQVAKDRGFTLVISSHTPEIPDLESIDVNTLNAMLLQRTVLFNDPKMDITQDVVIALDKAYANGGK